MSEMLYLKKLQSSGLDENDATLLSYKLLTADEVTASGIHGAKTPCLYIPYYNPETGKSYRCWEGTGKETDFFRVRALEDRQRKKTALEKAAPREPEPPYRQLPSTSNYIYYPRTIELHNTTWQTIIKDVNKPIIITEGELKAAKTCKVGFPCVAVAGVHNWTSKKTGDEVIPSLKQINFKTRTVYIAFDSDMSTNSQIKYAMLKLSETLLNLGAKVYCATVPSLSSTGKTGLDDYFVYHEPADNDVLIRNLEQDILQTSELLSSYKALSEYNKNFIFIRNTGTVYSIIDDKQMTRDHFMSVHENRFILKKYFTKDGDEKVKRVKSSKEWLEWGNRNQVHKIAFSPGKKKFINRKLKDGNMLRMYNTWDKWGVKPVEGDCKPFLDLIKFICAGSEKGTAKWFLQWLAYPIQHAGAKLSTAVMLVGAEGTGKGSIARVLSRIYAGHFRQLDNSTFTEKFTGWGLKTALLFADDLGSMRTKELMSQLKLWVTEPVFPIRQMYHETYNIENHMNIILATNEQDAIKMGTGDRRFTIIQTPPFKKERAFYDNFYYWLDKQEGAARAMHYLLNVDLSGFDPHGDALSSAAKDAMIVTASSDLSRFIREFIDNDDNLCDFVTASDILNRYRQDPMATSGARAKVNINSVNREFENSRFFAVFGGKRYRVNYKINCKFYAARNQQKWFDSSDDAIKEHIKKYYKEIDIVSNFDSQNAQDIPDTTDF